MDQRERANDFQEALRAMLDGFQARLWTALPASVVSFDEVKLTISAQPLIQGEQPNTDGTISFVSMPVCPDVPVIFPGGGGFQLTFPLQKGDEGLLVFSSLAIDNWWAQGGAKAPFELRRHDLSDGLFFPGLFSQPKKPSGHVSTSTTQLRSNDGQVSIEIDGSHNVSVNGATAINLHGKVVADGEVDLVGPLVVNGGAPIKRVGAGQLTFGPGVYAQNQSIQFTATVPGCVVGDVVSTGFSPAPSAVLIYNAWVISPGVVALLTLNPTTSAQPVAAQTVFFVTLGSA